MPEVSQVFEGQNIFVTGASDFMAKCCWRSSCERALMWVIFSGCKAKEGQGTQ